MKKFIALVFIIGLFFLAGCNENQNNNIQQSVNNSSTSTSQQSVTSVNHNQRYEAMIYWEQEGKIVPVRKQVGTISELVDTLFKGPSEDERKSGYFSELPNVTPNKVILEGDKVLLDLPASFYEARGSFRVSNILKQIVYTCESFPGVKKVVFLKDGNPISVFPGEGFVLAPYVDKNSIRGQDKQ
ncbi:Lipoprotein LpqB, GerMN domain protein [Thermodesulfobium narugense DSM 14796]|uniref:Lipoprotein LpqB, GerMN domain protein n=1 Tax=Thermodesulfobium narugense DSM 14796 TaxID=747365 RepID=M1E6G2_9BACT|nr:GerMN domain-containing protein [Thermodesulfobium narugense]AEE14786.1 Lipoprotein LpqB, GerMN domain protein [Thermodesulfobium narugense DSM 14796]